MSTSIVRRGFAVILAVLLGACALTAVSSVDSAWAATAKGWKTEQGHKCYYKNGAKLTGMQKIGKDYYYFNSKGVMRTGKVKAGDTTYYLGSTGKMEAYAKGSTFYKPTGTKMKSYQVKEYKTLLTARDYAAKITKKSMSKSQKLLACFKWVQKGYYHQYRVFRNYEGWAADFANDHFSRTWKGLRHGCCNADAAAFGYLALAIGYTDVYVGVDSLPGTTEGHGCTKINGRFYDPLFAEAKSFSRYYGTKNGGYHFRSVKLLVPSSSNNWNTSKYVGEKPAPSVEEVKATSKNGISKLDGDYYYFQNRKKVTKQWKNWKGARYYLRANGKAACGPVKINGTWYVFAMNGKLQKGTKTRVVKVSGEKYRVDKNGRAQAGWSTNKKNLYLANGRLATGLSLYKGQVYLLSDAGVYNEAKTEAIRAAAQKNADGAQLLKLLGKPLKKTSVTGCNPIIDEEGNEIWGNDVTYTYKNCVVEFLKGEDGVTYFRGFKAA